MGWNRKPSFSSGISESADTVGHGSSEVRLDLEAEDSGFESWDEHAPPLRAFGPFPTKRHMGAAFLGSFALVCMISAIAIFEAFASFLALVLMISAMCIYRLLDEHLALQDRIIGMRETERRSTEEAKVALQEAREANDALLEEAARRASSSPGRVRGGKNSFEDGLSALELTGAAKAEGVDLDLSGFVNAPGCRTLNKLLISAVMKDYIRALGALRRCRCQPPEITMAEGLLGCGQIGLPGVDVVGAAVGGIGAAPLPAVLGAVGPASPSKAPVGVAKDQGCLPQSLLAGPASVLGGASEPSASPGSLGASGGGFLVPQVVQPAQQMLPQLQVVPVQPSSSVFPAQEEFIPQPQASLAPMGGHTAQGTALEAFVAGSDPQNSAAGTAEALVEGLQQQQQQQQNHHQQQQQQPGRFAGPSGFFEQWEGECAAVQAKPEAQTTQSIAAAGSPTSPPIVEGTNESGAARTDRGAATCADSADGSGGAAAAAPKEAQAPEPNAPKEKTPRGEETREERKARRAREKEQRAAQEDASRDQLGGEKRQTFSGEGENRGETREERHARRKREKEAQAADAELERQNKPRSDFHGLFGR